jgi:hypothetical protein
LFINARSKKGKEDKKKKEKRRRRGEGVKSDSTRLSE